MAIEAATAKRPRLSSSSASNGAPSIFSEVEIAAERALTENRNGEERTHHRVVLGEADRAWILADVVHPQALPLAQRHSEEAASDRRIVDQGASAGIDAGGEEGLDASALVDHGEGAVAGVDQLPGLLDHLLQDGVERQFAVDVPRRGVEGQELAVAPLQAPLEAVDQGEDGTEEEHAPHEDHGAHQQLPLPGGEVGLELTAHDLEDPDEGQRRCDRDPLEA